MSSDNPILEYVGKIPIRAVNTVRLTLNQHDYKRIAEISDKTSLPISYVLAMQGKPCSNVACGNMSVTVVVPKNLLTTNKSNIGRSMTNRLENGGEKQGS